MAFLTLRAEQRHAEAQHQYACGGGLWGEGHLWRRAVQFDVGARLDIMALIRFGQLGSSVMRAMIAAMSVTEKAWGVSCAEVEVALRLLPCRCKLLSSRLPLKESKHQIHVFPIIHLSPYLLMVYGKKKK